MVLDNATSTDEPAADTYSFESESIDTSTSYAPGTILVNAPPNTISLDLPSRTGFSADTPAIQKLGTSITLQCQAATKLLGRPVRKEEAEAFTDTTARAYNMATWGYRGILGTSAAFLGYRWARPTPGTVDEVKTRSVTAKNLLRSRYIGPAMLTSFSAIVSMAFLVSYLSTVKAVHEMRDPRLVEYKQAILKVAHSGKRPMPEATTTTQNETFEQRRQRVGTQDMINRNRERARAAPDVDDASPTSGSLMEEWQDYAPEQFSDRAASASAPVQPSTKQEKSAGDAFYEFGNEASSSSATPSASVSQAAGSAWERIRQESEKTKNSRGSRE